jgi:hypothetical protein
MVRALRKIFTVLSNAGSNINFSQFYSVKNYFNPGFAATTPCSEFYIHSKYQFPFSDGGFKTFTFSGSSFLPRYNSGYSLFLQNDLDPQNILNYTRISAAYIYRVRLGNLRFAFWLQSEYNSLKINVNNVVLPSMIDPATGQLINSANLNAQTFRYQAKVNFGYLFWIKDFFIGNSANNLLTLNTDWEQSKYYTTVVGYTFHLRRAKMELYSFWQNLDYQQYGVIWEQGDIWFGTGAGFLNIFYLKKINFDIGFWLKNKSISFNYAVMVNKNPFSIYEVSIKFRFRCKKSIGKTIICPAYQL